MLDLNTLIAPGSGFQLTNAFNINDRGEILAKAAPLGFTPNDDADLGHIVLLVPCGEGEDCSASLQTASVAASTASPLKSLTPASLPTLFQNALTADENRHGWRGRLGHRYHIPGLGTPRD